MADLNLSINATENFGDSSEVFLHDYDKATSATGGCLRPTATYEVLEGNKLHDFIQEWICCVTGLRGPFVRPRWQPEPPNIPEEDWCAFGITSKDSDAYPAEVHFSDGEGTTQFRTHQRLTILSSFYGDSADNYAAILKDGMKLSQNREELNAKGFDVLEANDIVSFPEMIKNKWVYRADLTFVLVRQVLREYAIKNILSSQVDIVSDINSEPKINTVLITN